MVEIIAGEKGKGKTKVLIEKVNNCIKLTNGTIVYLDKNNKHMYELSNRIRLINVPDYNITNKDMFFGFISGIISQDNDLDKIFLDNFMSICSIDDSQLESAVLELDKISRDFNIEIVISISKDKVNLPDSIKDFVTIAL